MREIRPSGSVRGVRSNPYPYRDTFLPVRSMAGFDFHRFFTPHPAPIGPYPLSSHRIHHAFGRRINGVIHIAKIRQIGVENSSKLNRESGWVSVGSGSRHGSAAHPLDERYRDFINS